MKMSDWYQQEFEIRTDGRKSIEVTSEIASIVSASGIYMGVAHVFLRHTSASLMLTENADSAVQADLETVFSRLAPDGDPSYIHDYEGDDDMAAHVRSVLTTNDLTLPVSKGAMMLGTWQGIYLWEHRYQPHVRKFVITVSGQQGN
jgi:secondary thiamine-phosphate synthase enzyme